MLNQMFCSLSLYVREECVEEPCEQHGVEVDHDDQPDAASDEGPQFIAVVAGNAAAKIVGDLLVKFYKDNACDKDDQSEKERSEAKFIFHGLIILRAEPLTLKIKQISHIYTLATKVNLR